MYSHHWNDYLRGINSKLDDGSHSAQLLEDQSWQLPLFNWQRCCSSRGRVSLTMLGCVDIADKACRQRRCRAHLLASSSLAKSKSPESNPGDEVSLCDACMKALKPPWAGAGHRRQETHTHAQLLSKPGYQVAAESHRVKSSQVSCCFQRCHPAGGKGQRSIS